MPNRIRHPQRDSFQQENGQRPSRQSEQFQQDSESQYGETGLYRGRGYGPSQYEEGYPRDRQPYEAGKTMYRERGFSQQDWGQQNRIAERDDYDPLGDYDRASFAARTRNYGAQPSQQTHSYFRPDDFGGEDYTRSNYSDYGTRSSQMAGYAPSQSYGRSDERGFFDKAGDEVASWFGDEDAARRRKMDHRGRGPANYQRSDERLLEDACERLTSDPIVDATNINVTVADKEVTLDGTVNSRSAKRRAEDCVDDISGVKHVQNNLRVVQTDASWSSGDTSRSQEG